MNLAEALAQTAPKSRNQSHLAILLDKLGDDDRAQVIDALKGSHEAAHLSRALTKIAHSIGALPTDKQVSPQAVRDWRANNAPR